MNIKKICKDLLFRIENNLYGLLKKVSPDLSSLEYYDLIIIKLDGIGDAILCLNYIIETLKDERYRKSKVLYIGEISSSLLVENILKNFNINYYWISRKQYFKNLLYRVKVIGRLKKMKSQCCIHPTYSRDYYFSESVIRNINTNKMIGFETDLTNINEKNKLASNKYYHVLYQSPNEVIFEFARNKIFFENFLGKKLNLVFPYFNQNYVSEKINEEVVILYIGASHHSRKWPIEKYIEVARWIKKNTSYKILLCGGASEINEARIFKRYSKIDYIDMVNKLQYNDFMDAVKNASLVISNETNAPHLAMAISQALVLVISNGNHFGRFNPYPQGDGHRYYIKYPPLLEDGIEKHDNLLINQCRLQSKLNIDTITVESVIAVLKRSIAGD
jgi:ADP-heptose:LPS heptosyltransferase